MIFKRFDISKHDKIENFVETVCDELKGCQILINNAGITKDNLSKNVQTEWQQVIDINLTSTFLLCKFFKEDDQK